MTLSIFITLAISFYILASILGVLLLQNKEDPGRHFEGLMIAVSVLSFFMIVLLIIFLIEFAFCNTLVLTI